MTLLQPSLATHNTAELQVTCRTVDGVTQIVEKYYKAPLKISKAFREDGSDRLCLYMVDVSPGMLDGDRYHLDFELKENCHLVLTNQSFTKVHPCPRDEAQLHAKFRVGEGAVLEYFPEPTIPYADSVLKAVQRFDLASDATLLFAEVNTPGRTHRDEQYQFRRLDNQVEVYRAGKLVVWDHFLAEPLQSQIHATGAMESYTHNSTFWILTARPSQTLLERIRGILSQLDEANMLAAASLTADKGICVRMLGHNVWQLQQLIQTIWNACREELLQLPACYFRK